MERTSQLGDISNMTAEPVFPAQEAIYTCMLDTAAGPLFTIIRVIFAGRTISMAALTALQNMDVALYV